MDESNIAEPPVELVGGPIDGLEIKWPSNKETASIKYYGGFALYKLEGNGSGKAKYLKG